MNIREYLFHLLHALNKRKIFQAFTEKNACCIEQNGQLTSFPLPEVDANFSAINEKRADKTRKMGLFENRENEVITTVTERILL